jgi:NAD(P)-dependent dehydrogenase (short-subunit alcohol dehydrogenase family)
MRARTVAITGATRGIGRAVAEAFAERGDDVALCARSGDAVDRTVDALSAAAGEVRGVEADVRYAYDVQRFVEEAVQTGAGDAIDVLVANAGLNPAKPGQAPLGELSYDDFDATIATNVRGVFATVKEAMPHLARDARVMVPSGSVARPDGAKPGMGAYAVSKAAAEALVRGVHDDTHADAFIVEPGIVATEVTGGRGKDPADVAGLFTWVATEADPDDYGGDVVGLRAWKTATR